MKNLIMFLIFVLVAILSVSCEKPEDDSLMLQNLENEVYSNNE